MKCVQQWFEADSWSPIMCTWTMFLARALNILKGQQIHFPQMTWIIVLLSRSWCDLWTTVTHVWRKCKDCVASIVIFHCPDIELESSVTLRCHLIFPFWRITKNLESYSKWNLFHFHFHEKKLPHCVTVLYDAVTFSVGPPLFLRVSKLVTMVRFLSVPVRVGLSGSWWCENWYLVIYVWPLTHSTVKAL